ncbi:MAG: phosphohistidine phosphatase [Nocardioidaceae bacterium]|nr:phosphohistidine phosphatase [Nocardioidaceae bacterium]
MLRHAKAEPFAATDHERRLTDRGRESASEVGRYLRESNLLPDFALVSSAMRTRETWEAVAEAAGATGTRVSYDDAVFTGSPDVVLEALRGIPAESSTVVFVGHNPTAAYLCHLLDDGEGDPSAVSGLLQGFPPAALAVLDLHVAWADLAAESGRLVGYHVGTS